MHEGLLPPVREHKWMRLKCHSCSTSSTSISNIDTTQSINSCHKPLIWPIIIVLPSPNSHWHADWAPSPGTECICKRRLSQIRTNVFTSLGRFNELFTLPLNVVQNKNLIPEIYKLCSNFTSILHIFVPHHWSRDHSNILKKWLLIFPEHLPNVIFFTSQQVNNHS